MLLDDVYTYLTGLNLVNGSTGWPCYKGYIPDDSDQMVALFETGGMPATTLLRESETVTFQIRVRGARLDYGTARSQWQALFNALQDSTPASGYAFVQALHFGPMVFQDAKGRPNMTANFRVLKARS